MRLQEEYHFIAFGFFSFVCEWPLDRCLYIYLAKKQAFPEEVDSRFQKYNRRSYCHMNENLGQ